jgi:hypothetical protein
MRELRNQDPKMELPPCAVEFIGQVVKKIRYRRKIRREVQVELIAHFEDELRGCENPQEGEQKARRLIGEFGDAGLLAVLCRRAKKRCRPLWQKALVRSMQVAGALLLYLVICAVPLFAGKPAIRVNYADWLSERWRPAQAGIKNARTYYDQAAALYLEPSEPLAARRRSAQWTVRDCNEADLQLLATWFDEIRAAFDLLRKGTNTADYWPVYDVNKADWARSKNPLWMALNVLPLALESTASYRSLALAWRDSVAYQARSGAVDEAMSDSLVLIRFGLHLKDKGLLTEQMVGIAIEALGHSAMYGVLQRPGIPVEILARVQDELASAFERDRDVINLEGEKVFWYDIIQRTFTDNGHGGGRALPSGLPFATGDWRGGLARMLLFDYPDRRVAVTLVDSYFEQAQKAARTPPNSGKSHPIWAELKERMKRNPLLSGMVPADSGIARVAWHSTTAEAALVTIVAVHRYQAENGVYPDGLEELVTAGFLARLPNDPFGEGPLTYRRTAEGFLLYSWGQNLIDDGGWRGTGQDGQAHAWVDNGDDVFWPVSP